MTFEKAEVCFSVAFIDLCFVCRNTVLSAVLFLAMIIAFLDVQIASSTRYVFYGVGANGACLLHLRILLMSMTSLA